MFENILDILKSNPQIVVFLAIAIGYFIGRLKIFGFSMGSTAGVLIAALVLGQMDINVPPLLKAVGFALFIFTIGYKIGPQFFGALKKEGLNYIWISLVVTFTGLGIAILLGKVFGFDRGITAGLLGGALTQSSVIGTAEGAIKHLAVSAADKATLQSNVAIAYAITYIFGTAGLVIFFKLVPRLMGIDLKKEAKKLEAEMSGNDNAPESPELFSWYKKLTLRAYKINNDNIAGKSVMFLESSFPGHVAVEKIKRADTLVEATPDTIINKDDEVALIGDRGQFLNAVERLGTEVDDKNVIDVVGEILDICVLNKQAAGKTLGVLSKSFGHGCFLKKITRQGHEIPITKNTIIEKCDVLQVTGAQKDVEKLVGHLGYPERATTTTDLITVALGCVIGTLIGLIIVPIAGIPITLGTGGGILVAGLVCGWLRSMHPTFGQIPTGAQWIFTDLGLTLFVACIGLMAGPKAVEALRTTGMSIFFAGVILSLTPHIIGILFGRYILKVNPVLLFGALTGAGTVTAALNALKEEADSAMPALGYAIPYAFGNVILTIWGTVIINVM